MESSIRRNVVFVTVYRREDKFGAIYGKFPVNNSINYPIQPSNLFDSKIELLNTVEQSCNDLLLRPRFSYLKREQINANAI